MNATGEASPYLGPAPNQSKVLRKLFLTLFLRGRSARGLQKEAAPKTLGRKLAVALLFYGLYGAFALFFIQQGVMMFSVYLHAMTFMFIGMFVASSAGEVLFNQAEADILLHRPVNPKAMLWAKISMLVQVALWLALALNLIGLIAGAFMKGSNWMYLVAHILSTVVEALFTTGCFILAYQVCLRWLGRERLDGIMTTVQVGVSILIVVGAQLLPRVIGNTSNPASQYLDSWWLAVLPPMWFAAFDHALVGAGTTHSWVLAGIGVLATAIVLGVAFGRLAQSYETGLQKLSEIQSRQPKKLRRRWTQKLISWPGFKWWLRDPVTRASFLLTTAYMLRDRDVKLRLYPGIAPILVLPVVFLMQGSGREDGPGGAFGLAMASGYMGLIPMLALNILQYSQNWLAADLFRLTPLRGPGAISHGARKAVLLFLTLPMVLLTVIIAIALGAKPAQLIMLLPGVLMIPVFAMLPGAAGRCLPLSKPPEDAKAANRGLSMIGMIFVAMAIAGMAAFAQHTGWLHFFLIGEIIIVAGICWLCWKRVNRVPWGKVE